MHCLKLSYILFLGSTDFTPTVLFLNFKNKLIKSNMEYRPFKKVAILKKNWEKIEYINKFETKKLLVCFQVADNKVSTRGQLMDLLRCDSASREVCGKT